MTTLLRVIKTIFISAIAFTVLSLASGCVTGSRDVVPSGFPGGLIGRKPAWIDHYPSDPAYYIGIGSANTGKKSDDMDLAKSKAMVNLASSISADIRSELLISAGETSEGAAYETVEQVIRESVDTNVREVEVVDSYYSQAEGYWFYLRLSKSVWESIRLEEAERLSRRVVGLVNPVLADSSATIAARLRTLWRGRSLLVESPYGQQIESNLHGSEGVLLDLIDNLITAYVDSLSLEFKPNRLETQVGRPVPVVIDVRSTFELSPGEVTIGLSFGQGSGPAIDIVTGADGYYEGEIAYPRNEIGNTKLAASIHLESTGIDPGVISGSLSVPQAEATLVVSAIPAYLTVTTPEEMDGQGIRRSFEELICTALPVELTPSSAADFEISVDVIAREAPKNDFGLIITYIKVFISVSRDGTVLETFQSQEIKDGGLTLSQAYARTFAVLFDSLKDAPTFTEKLEKAFMVTSS